jgi:hypothetical protein
MPTQDKFYQTTFAPIELATVMMICESNNICKDLYTCLSSIVAQSLFKVAVSVLANHPESCSCGSILVTLTQDEMKTLQSYFKAENSFYKKLQTGIDLIHAEQQLRDIDAP